MCKVLRCVKCVTCVIYKVCKVCNVCKVCKVLMCVRCVTCVKCVTRVECVKLQMPKWLQAGVLPPEGTGSCWTHAHALRRGEFAAISLCAACLYSQTTSNQLANTLTPSASAAISPTKLPQHSLLCGNKFLTSASVRYSPDTVRHSTDLTYITWTVKLQL